MSLLKSLNIRQGEGTTSRAPCRQTLRLSCWLLTHTWRVFVSVRSLARFGSQEKVRDSSQQLHHLVRPDFWSSSGKESQPRMQWLQLSPRPEALWRWARATNYSHSEPMFHGQPPTSAQTEDWGHLQLYQPACWEDFASPRMLLAILTSYLDLFCLVMTKHSLQNATVLVILVQVKFWIWELDNRPKPKVSSSHEEASLGSWILLRRELRLLENRILQYFVFTGVEKLYSMFTFGPFYYNDLSFSCLSIQLRQCMHVYIMCVHTSTCT